MGVTYAEGYLDHRAQRAGDVRRLAGGQRTSSIFAAIAAWPRAWPACCIAELSGDFCGDCVTATMLSSIANDHARITITRMRASRPCAPDHGIDEGDPGPRAQVAVRLCADHSDDDRRGFWRLMVGIIGAAGRCGPHDGRFAGACCWLSSVRGWPPSGRCATQLWLRPDGSAGRLRQCAEPVRAGGLDHLRSHHRLCIRARFSPA
jgi:hypothetical protein